MIDNVKTIFWVLTLSLSWLLSLSLAHFQVPSPLNRFIDFFVFLSFFFAVQYVLKLQFPNIIVILGVICSLFAYLIAFSLQALDVNLPYIIWSKLGVGTMFIDGDLQPFGDLAQLTSAVSCARPLILGTDVCDPWGRLLNQNIDVIEIMRLLHLSNLYLVGLVSVIILYLLILNDIVKSRSRSLAVPIFLFTPVTILAIERGNEVITVLLVLSAVTLFKDPKLSVEIFASSLLIIAAIFKLWPIIFVVFFLILMGKNLHRFTICFLLIPVLYWVINFESARKAVISTQSGSPFGVSFGAQLLMSSQLTISSIIEYCIYTVFTLCMVIFLYHRKLNSSWRCEMTHLESTIVTSSVLSYSFIWLGGESFVYRMLALLPALVVLARSYSGPNENSSLLVAFIIASSMTSRLQISIAITSALALFAVYFVCANHARTRKLKLSSTSMTRAQKSTRYIC